jgi:biopolymer transport protein ExbB/TolQ
MGDWVVFALQLLVIVANLWAFWNYDRARKRAHEREQAAATMEQAVKDFLAAEEGRNMARIAFCTMLAQDPHAPDHVRERARNIIPPGTELHVVREAGKVH